VNKKILLLAGAGIIVTLGTVMGIYFFGLDLVSHGSGTVDGAPKERGDVSEFAADLDVFVINLADATRNHYLRTTLSLGVEDEQQKERVKILVAPIRHAVIMYLSQRTAAELMDPQGKEQLRQSLQQEINHVVGREVVSRVYFKEFLIQ
jgi:flagellar basal body-associated protein FliL